MHRFKNILFVFTLLCLTFSAYSQKRIRKWYFGTGAGLDFTTSPPTILTNGVTNCYEGTATICDTSGNLLFYTDGVTIWNQMHAAMPNGTGLLGSQSSVQSSVIVKQPGNNNIYFVFTQESVAQPNGMCYSVVDMNLAGGMGSVTAKNILLQTPSTERLSAVMHCNGRDVWVISHDMNSNSFRTFLVTAIGVNMSPVVSSVGSLINGNAFIGAIKTSPDGKKLGMSAFLQTTGFFEVYDFDASTGVVSNPVTLGSILTQGYGCEFSPDGSKFYGSRFGMGQILQWDLCAGSSTAIANSQYIINIPIANSPGSMQLGLDGKIYVAFNGASSLGVIGSPNLGGASCNFAAAGQSLGTGSSQLGLPNFVCSYFLPDVVSPPFTHTVSTTSCQTASFTAHTNSVTVVPLGCGISPNYSIVSLAWNFGDPASGAANASGQAAPTHSFTGIGTYSVQLILNYNCHSDTIRETVIINTPCLIVNSTSITCSGLGSATISPINGQGPFSYTWMPTAQNGSVASGLGPGTYTLSVYDAFTGSTYTSSTYLAPLVPLTASISVSNSLSCGGANTGTGVVTAINGGSGSQSYWWSNGTTALTTSSVNTLIAGVHTVLITDAVSGCVFTQTFTITQPPAILLVISGPSVICAGSGAVLTASASGGMPGYTYTWTLGPATAAYSVSPPVGNYVYAVLARDANGCLGYASANVSAIGSPTLGVTNTSICPQQTGTLSVSGAATYTWTGNVPGSTFTSSPLATTVYTVTGAVSGCTSAATATISVKAALTGSLSATSSLSCNGINTGTAEVDALSGGSGSQAYLWTNGTAAQTTSMATGLGAGLYTVAVTDAVSGCAFSQTFSIYQPPALALAIVGPSIACAGSTAAITASATGGTPGYSYTWTAGPIAPTYSITQTTPGNYVYTVSAVDGNGCQSDAGFTLDVIGAPALSISNVSICPLQTGTLLISGAASYTWSGGNAGNTFAASPSVTTVYTVTGAVSGCSSTTVAAIVVKKEPAALFGSNSPVCGGNSLILSGNGGQSYLWSGPMGFSSTDQVVNINPATAQSSGLYTLVVMAANGCSASATSSISVGSAPVFSGRQAICQGDKTVLTFSGADSYNWSPPTGLNTTTGPMVVASPAVSTRYTVNMVSGQCATSQIINVEVHAAPYITAGKDATYNLGDPIFLSAKGTGTITWVSGEGIVCGNCPDTQVMPYKTGCYVAQVQNEFGCVATDGVCLEILDDFSIYVPNTFTPNDNGLNDDFFVYGVNIAGFKLELYDRWGNRIFVSEDQRQGWDGTYREQPCQQGVYVYKLYYRDGNDKERSKTGHVTLIR